MKYILIWMTFAVAASTVSAASFDCAKAGTAVEKMICSDSQLSDLDSQLMHAYKKSISNSANADTLKSEQRTWLVIVRNKCVDSTCLTQAYTDRIGALNTSISASLDVNKETSSPITSPVQAQRESNGSTDATASATASHLPATASTPQTTNSNKDGASPISSHETTTPNANAATKSNASSSNGPTNDSSAHLGSQNSNGGGGPKVQEFIAIAGIVFLLVVFARKHAARRGNWFKLEKVNALDLHGKQVHSGLIMCDTQKELLINAKEVMNEVECPQCGNHKLKGNVTVNYGPVQIFKEIKKSKGYENELVAKKWLYYGPQLEAGEHVECPDCKWEMKNSRFEDFGTKAAIVIAASVAAHQLFSKSSK